MANILDLQSAEFDETPEAPKKSRVSLRWCHNSLLSLAMCMVK